MIQGTAEIAIIGAGPAGAHLASRLAAAGRDCVLFDPRGAWEKPCGGGVPTRAIREFSFILESSNYPRRLVRRITMVSPVGRRVSVNLSHPFAVFSRKVLNGLVLDRALGAGARFIRDGVVGFSRQGDGWSIETGDGSLWRARFLVGADGAASPTRRHLVGIFPIKDLALALGYNVTSDQFEDQASSETAIIRFAQGFTGYYWAFPRPGGMNFGVASKLGECASTELKRLLGEFIREYYGGKAALSEGSDFFAAKIPILNPTSWPRLKVTGDGWALIGDAAGFVDPITGEGIYYALKSADLLADAIVSDCTGRAVEHYELLWRECIGRELEKASKLIERFYHGYFMGQMFSDAMIRYARFHKGVRKVMLKAIVGEQSYTTLKRDLLKAALQVF